MSQLHCEAAPSLWEPDTRHRQGFDSKSNTVFLPIPTSNSILEMYSAKCCTIIETSSTFSPLDYLEAFDFVFEGAGEEGIGQLRLAVGYPIRDVLHFNRTFTPVRFLHLQLVLLCGKSFVQSAKTHSKLVDET